MPTGRLNPDSTWTWEYSYAWPYSTLVSHVALLPWLQVGGGVTTIKPMPPVVADPRFFESYGAYKDKTFFGKIQLLNETAFLPAVAYTLTDPFGTELFRGQALSASKRFGNLDVTLGYGDKRPSGWFGGARYELPAAGDHRFAVMAEYDAIDYSKDKFADRTGLDKTDQKIAYGLEYRWNWLGLRLTRQHDANGAMGFVNIPLDRKEFIPKFEEPERYRKITPQPTEAQWLADGAHRRRLLLALLQQDFRNIRLDYRPDTRVLSLELGHPRISKMSRAVGRAAQAALLLGPTETREIRVTYVDGGMAMATYAFFDVARLRKYFNGQIPRQELAPYVDIRYAQPVADRSAAELREVRELLTEVKNEDAARLVVLSEEGDPLLFRMEDYDNNQFRLRLNLQSYLNGPGAFQYSLNLQGAVNTQFGPRTGLSTGLVVPLAENLSDAGVVESDSTLPIVRSDMAKYWVQGKPRLERLLLNHYMHLRPEVYARLSGGIYEVAFGGVGGQVLYAPERKPWAVDLAVDAVQKRDYDGWFGFTDYGTVTAIASMHYRMGGGLTGTLRAGKFLARDLGVRAEVKRRFESGFELGAWYTRTDAHDTTGPAASEGGVYYDKGVFARIAFDALGTRDTRARGTISLSAWGRDPGQMVASPGDLYGIVEDPLRHNLYKDNGLSRLADVDDDPTLPSLGTGFLDRPILELATPGILDSFDVFSAKNGWRYLAIAGGLTALSTAADKTADKWAVRHQDDQWVARLGTAGNGLAAVAVGLAGLAASDATDTRLARTGLSSLIATGTGVAISELTKAAVHRSRPDMGMGPSDFSASGGGSSFPSNHTTAMWAAVTPFAKEYDVPWLYGVAAVTNFARVATRRHWFSDTVAGAFLGYGVGSLLWDARRGKSDDGPAVYLTGNGVGVSVPLK